MPKITIIVAADLNNAIGVSGGLPWHLPQDLRFFKNTTWAMPVIMGRKTFESMGKALPGRTNIVVSQNPDWNKDQVWKAGSLENAVSLADDLKTEEVFIIGGGTIYEKAMNIADRIYLTRVFTKVNNADTWFPPLDPAKWEMKWERPFKADEKHLFDYSFQCWERKN